MKQFLTIATIKVKVIWSSSNFNPQLWNPFPNEKDYILTRNEKVTILDGVKMLTDTKTISLHCWHGIKKKKLVYIKKLITGVFKGLALSTMLHVSSVGQYQGNETIFAHTESLALYTE